MAAHYKSRKPASTFGNHLSDTVCAFVFSFEALQTPSRISNSFKNNECLTSTKKTEVCWGQPRDKEEEKQRAHLLLSGLTGKQAGLVQAY